MRREGRLRGRPTNKRRGGKTRRRALRAYPVEKSLPKRIGRYKRFADDVCTNPALFEFFVQRPSLKHLPRGLADCAEGRWASDYEYESESVDDETTTLADRAELIRTIGDATDIGAIELAFGKQFGIFENAAAGPCFSELANEGWSTLSEESWSDVVLVESDEERLAHEDEWFMVSDVDEMETHE